MTSREKAIKALDKQYQCNGQIASVDEIIVIEGEEAIIECKAIDLQMAIIALNQPTLDDCIAVVEKKRQEFMRDVYPEHASIVSLYDDILTALRGLKERE